MPITIPKLPNRLTQTAKNWADKQKEQLAQLDLKEKFDQALETWKSSKTRERAEALLSDQGKLEHFLQDIEKKLARLPFGGDKFSAIPGLISMVRSYIRRDYSKLPKGTILAIIGALIYFFSPIDALPDFILGAGLLDDAFVLNACLKLIKTDVDDFRSWQASQWKAEE
ncbi:YkvA family protein [Streptococcus suis]|uniref:YkvA family protein n=1 Tax=Streptococcus suis TaxID=1307 RepID=UPI0004110E66|nr:YkvA family protein [Streptococcus suis]